MAFGAAAAAAAAPVHPTKKGGFMNGTKSVNDNGH